MTLYLIPSLLAGAWFATFAGTVRWALTNRERTNDADAT